MYQNKVKLNEKITKFTNNKTDNIHIIFNLFLKVLLKAKKTNKIVETNVATHSKIQTFISDFNNKIEITGNKTQDKT